MSNIKLASAKTAITNLKPVTHPSIMVTDCYYERLLLLHTMTARLRLWCQPLIFSPSLNALNLSTTYLAVNPRKHTAMAKSNVLQ